MTLHALVVVPSAGGTGVNASWKAHDKSSGPVVEPLQTHQRNDRSRPLVENEKKQMGGGEGAARGREFESTLPDFAHRWPLLMPGFFAFGDPNAQYHHVYRFIQGAIPIPFHIDSVHYLKENIP